MEKIIVIDGKEVPMKTTGATGIRYKAQFGRDMFADMFGLQAFMPLFTGGNIPNKAQLKDMDFDIIYNLAWVYAKTADKDISDPLSWLDSFSEFPVCDIVVELQDLIIRSLKTSKKK
ncbi:hypothetical protein RCJ96_26645 [Bacillus sp. BSL6]|uniref:Prophage pi2 protein 40 n=1 Tax=Bacillus luti TaxID=2026191 RepID=A0A7V7SDF4_9BACI|nr:MULTISPECIES: hypothetical protein [Bacillus cereus group]KAA0763000.1 hypothetical protein DN410_17895 [Bacillus sp. SH5-2]KAB2444946.1 hypothetical protein F8163_07110 [Bacillus luti]